MGHPRIIPQELLPPTLLPVIDTTGTAATTNNVLPEYPLTVTTTVVLLNLPYHQLPPQRIIRRMTAGKPTLHILNNIHAILPVQKITSVRNTTLQEPGTHPVSPAGLHHHRLGLLRQYLKRILHTQTTNHTITLKTQQLNVSQHLIATVKRYPSILGNPLTKHIPNPPFFSRITLKNQYTPQT